MKRILITLCLLVSTSSSFAAIPPSSFFAGLSLDQKGFVLENTDTQKDFKYSASTMALAAGFRGAYSRIFVQFTPEKTFKSDDSDSKIDYSSWSISAGLFKSFDLLYLAADIDREEVNLDYSLGALPEGADYGVRVAFGGFLGRVSLELGLRQGITTHKKDHLKLKSVTTSSFTVAGHF